MDLFIVALLSIQIYVLFNKVWKLEEKIKEMEGANNE